MAYLPRYGLLSPTGLLHIRVGMANSVIFDARIVLPA